MGSTSISFSQAVKEIVSMHNANYGGNVEECCYPLGELTDAEEEISNEYFWSMFGAVYYHEYAHYYLYAILDFLRGQFDISGIVLYTSAIEDDADYMSGVLIAKAGLNREVAKLEFELMTYYWGRRNGLYDEFSEVPSDAVIQFTKISSAYSPLATRKANFSNGYDRY